MTSKRFPGFTKEQWEAEKQKTGLNDQQLYDVLRISGGSNYHDQRRRRFYRSGQIGALK
jgi:hypothetical protein